MTVSLHCQVALEQFPDKVWRIHFSVVTSYARTLPYSIVTQEENPHIYGRNPVTRAFTHNVTTFHIPARSVLFALFLSLCFTTVLSVLAHAHSCPRASRFAYSIIDSTSSPKCKIYHSVASLKCIAYSDCRCVVEVRNFDNN